MPIVATAIWSLLNLGPWLRPEKFDQGLRNSLFLLGYAELLLQGGIFAVQILYARGHTINMNYVVWPLLVVVFASTINLVARAVRSKLGQNHPPSIGIQS